jgi:hypothetical protein
VVLCKCFEVCKGKIHIHYISLMTIFSCNPYYSVVVHPNGSASQNSMRVLFLFFFFVFGLQWAILISRPSPKIK